MSIDGARWYVCESHFGREDLVLENLERQGFNSYLPLQLFNRVKKGQPDRSTSRPFFPGYVFTQVDLAIDRWRAIYSTRGVKAVLGSRERPTAVPERFIADIRAAEIEGFIRLMPATPDCRFKSGDCVTYKGFLQAIFCERVDARRCSILIELLGKTSRATVDITALS